MSWNIGSSPPFLDTPQDARKELTALFFPLGDLTTRYFFLSPPDPTIFYLLSLS